MKQVLTLTLVLLLSGCIASTGTPSDSPTVLSSYSHPETMLLDPENIPIIQVEIDHHPDHPFSDESLEYAEEMIESATGKPVHFLEQRPISRDLIDSGKSNEEIHLATFDTRTPGPVTTESCTRNGSAAVVHVIVASLPRSAGFYHRGPCPFISVDISEDDPDDNETTIVLPVPNQPLVASTGATTLTHELGHALGLVGYIPQVHERRVIGEDGRPEAHSRYNESIMRPSASDIVMVDGLRSGVHVNGVFDQYDMQDIHHFQRANQDVVLAPASK